MKKVINGAVGVEQGSLVLFSDYADGGPMWTGNGPRESRRKITFTQTFRSAPAVSVSISMWDLDQKTNARADLSAEKITRSGFQLVFRTWGDTRVARIRADWMAIGAVRDDDDWEID